jgi:hypothetical protein
LKVLFTQSPPKLRQSHFDYNTSLEGISLVQK